MSTKRVNLNKLGKYYLLSLFAIVAENGVRKKRRTEISTVVVVITTNQTLIKGSLSHDKNESTVHSLRPERGQMPKAIFDG